MKTKYDALEELATKAAQGHWDAQQELKTALLYPATLGGLIADVKALAEALIIARGHIEELCNEGGHSVPKSGMDRIDAALSRIQEPK